MKIFDTIKKHVAFLFNKYEKQSPLQHLTESIKYSDCDGPTDLQVHSIHGETDIKWSIKNTTFDMTEEELDDMLKKTLSSKNIDIPGKKKVLLDIYGDCLNLHKALIPLIDLNIVYSIDLVGGSIRDFLLNNHNQIKDLDVLVKLTCDLNHVGYAYYQEDVSNKQLSTEKILKKEWCTKEELDEVEFNDNDLLYRKHNKLLQLCLNRDHKLTSTKIFSKDERKIGEGLYGTDILKELSGIIKVESESLHYPMEVLLTDQSRDIFYRAIDFGICNVGLKIVDLSNYGKMNLIGCNDIKNNFVLSIDFLEDAKNKTITYNTHNKSAEQIEFSLLNHLKRINEKYPEHKFQLSDNEMNEETKRNIDTVMLMMNLSDTLNSQDKPVEKKRKNKI